jgi:hypothetical protein
LNARACPAWYHEDNVFKTVRRMDWAHRPIVALACRTLRGSGGNAIDLGCGNGALIAKIHALEPRITPFGIERDPARVAHARALLPAFAANFFAADLGAHPLLADARRFALAILSPRRLHTLEAAEAERLRGWLRARCERLLVYAYGSGRTQFGNLGGFAREVGIELDANAADRRAALALRW